MNKHIRAFADELDPDSGLRKFIEEQHPEILQLSPSSRDFELVNTCCLCETLISSKGAYCDPCLRKVCEEEEEEWHSGLRQ